MSLLSFAIPAATTLLGGLAGSKGQTKTAQETPWAAPWLEDLYNQAQGMPGPPNPYLPAQNAPFNEVQRAAMSGFGDYTQNRFNPGMAYHQGMLTGMYESPSQLMQNPALHSMMQANIDAAGDLFTQKIAPRFDTGATVQGVFGSAGSDRGKAMAAGEVARNLTQQNTQMMLPIWQGLMSSKNQAAQLMPQALALGYQGPQQMMGVGDRLQSLDQANRGQWFQNYMWPYNQNMQHISNLAGIYKGDGGGTTTSTSGGGAAGAIGGGLAGLGMGQEIANNLPTDWGFTQPQANIANPADYSYGGTSPMPMAYNPWG